MAMKITRISASISAVLAALGDLTEGPKARLSIDETWGDGSASNQAESMIFDQRSLAGGANEDIDLKTAADGQGVALGFAELRVLIIRCPKTNTANIQLSPSAVDGWTTFLSSSGATDNPQIDIAPGAQVWLVAPVDGSYAVAASNDSINFLNLDGANANTYTLFAIGTQS